VHDAFLEKPSSGTLKALYPKLYIYVIITITGSIYSAGGLLAPEGIILPVVSVSLLVDY
jgi:hypothetical protein